MKPASKIRRGTLGAVVAAALLCAAPGIRAAGADVARAADPAGTVVLTLDEALQLAKDRNRDIARALEYQRYVRGRYLEERSAALPNLTLEASHLKASDETQTILFGGGGSSEEGGLAFSIPTDQLSRSAQVNVTQTLFAWGKVGAAIRAARFGIASAEDQLRLFRQAAVRDVTASFVDVLLAREMVDIARQNLAQRERHLDEARKKLALGTATDYDVLAAEVAVQNARPELIRAENAVLITREQLRFLLAETREVDVRGSLAVEPERPPRFDDALRTALEQRPDLAEQRHRLDVYRELLKIARADNKPRLDFAGSYGRKYLDVGFADGSGATWSAGVFLKFPLFDGGRTRGRALGAMSDLNTQDIVAKKLEDQVSLEVRNAIHSVEESASILAALGGTVTQAERLLGMAENGFRLGVKTRLEVEDAQLNLQQARGNLARAQRDHLVAQVTLRYVTGAIPTS